MNGIAGLRVKIRRFLIQTLRYRIHIHVVHSIWLKRRYTVRLIKSFLRKCLLLIVWKFRGYFSFLPELNSALQSCFLGIFKIQSVFVSLNFGVTLSYRRFLHSCRSPIFVLDCSKLLRELILGAELSTLQLLAIHVKSMIRGILIRWFNSFLI